MTTQGIKRQTECRYAHVANLLEETSRSAANGRRMTRPPKKKNTPDGPAMIPNIADRGAINDHQGSSRGAAALSIGLLSHVPYSVTKASNVFGIGSEHPFANYWTCEGGLPEVVSVLPDKVQADTLVARYFECVDPVYPMIHRQTFYADYEHFWRMSTDERNKMDPSFIALIFVILALGTQFVSSTTPKDRKQTAEFYASASNQALRMFSYLSSASIRSIQAMVLITYFLINDNHASDGWAFAGILIRQAYAMGLHRDPNIEINVGCSLYSNTQCQSFRKTAAAKSVAGRSFTGHILDCPLILAAFSHPHRCFCRRFAGRQFIYCEQRSDGHGLYQGIVDAGQSGPGDHLFPPVIGCPYLYDSAA
ncbi:hypothetical protein J3458_020494 [Metarhizium acridum]|uniref:uncharacterized protein n=1 Tax=Metarhizium acridum TaxID=92637 RepID=UPI001C6B7393|nr:hypothetical protein J3458_020494 [Metarhizium acridum]